MFTHISSKPPFTHSCTVSHAIAAAMLAWAAMVTSPAHAEPCSDLEEGEASATLTTVSIGQHRWLVAGQENRGRFESFLVSCGGDEAAQDFDDWRAARRTVNEGLFVMFVPYVGILGDGMIIGGGLSAGKHKHALLLDLTTLGTVLSREADMEDALRDTAVHRDATEPALNPATFQDDGNKAKDE